MSDSLGLWVGFNAFVLFMLALDLGVFHKKSHTVSVKEALTWSAVWIAMAMIFNAWLYYSQGSQIALEFLTGYVIEKSLSVDNIFVFLMIFAFFNVPKEYQHKVLFWGIIGALLMRAIMIFVGAALIAEFHWVIYIFGAFLIFTGIRMAVQKEQHQDLEQNPVVRLFKKIMPVTPDLRGDKFFVKIDSKTWATPLFVVLLIVEFSDLIFAVDSIPAIFAVTQDTFIVYTSNVFAILGLRSLYFALAGIMNLFHFLKMGLAVVLVFVGIKMVIVDFYKIPILYALGFIFITLLISILASLLFPKKEIKPEQI